MIKHTLKIIDIVDEGNNTKTFYLEKPMDFNWEEGSHTHIALPNYDLEDTPNKSLVRHMSIMTCADENRIGFTTRFPEQKSEYKTMLDTFRVGDQLKLFKLGSRMKLRRENRNIVLLSMGVGIATMRPLILSYCQDKQAIPKLIHINVDAKHSIYREEIETLSNESFINIWSKSRVEYFQTLSNIMKQSDSIYYIVGSDSFLRTTIQKLKAAGVKIEDIMIDKKDGILNLYYEF